MTGQANARRACWSPSGDPGGTSATMAGMAILCPLWRRASLTPPGSARPAGGRWSRRSGRQPPPADPADLGRFPAAGLGAERLGRWSGSASPGCWWCCSPASALVGLVAAVAVAGSFERCALRGGRRVAPGLRRLRRSHRGPVRRGERRGAGARLPAPALGGGRRGGHRSGAALRLAPAARGPGPARRLRRQAGRRLRRGAGVHRRARVPGEPTRLGGLGLRQLAQRRRGVVLQPAS